MSYQRHKIWIAIPRQSHNGTAVQISDKTELSLVWNLKKMYKQCQQESQSIQRFKYRADLQLTAEANSYKSCPLTRRCPFCPQSHHTWINCSLITTMSVRLVLLPISLQTDYTYTCKPFQISWHLQHPGHWQIS